MVMASHWVGFTLPGMIEEPGSFSGMLISPRPPRGPGPATHIVGDLHQGAAKVLTAPWANDQGVVAGEIGELVGGT